MSLLTELFSILHSLLQIGRSYGAMDLSGICLNLELELARDSLRLPPDQLFEFFQPRVELAL